MTADLNGDGCIDIYVTNDMNPNFLFLNKGDGTFEDASEASGAAFDEKGQAHSGMGVDAEDIDGDGKPDLIVTNFTNEYNTLYQNTGSGTFMDVTPYVGLASETMPWVGWGTALADFDNDGWPACTGSAGMLPCAVEVAPEVKLPACFNACRYATPLLVSSGIVANPDFGSNTS